MVELGLDDLVVAAVAAGVGPALALARTANEAAADPEAARGLDAESYVDAAGHGGDGQAERHPGQGGAGRAAAQAAATRRPSPAQGLRGHVRRLAGRAVAEVVAAHPDEWARYCEGDDKLAGFFTGQVMKATKGRANGKAVAAELAPPRG